MKKKKVKSLAKLKKQAWDLLSKCIRREAANLDGYAECVTCGSVDEWAYMHAGHAIGGRTGSVLLDEEILRVQCPRCNIFMHGNYQMFTVKLIKEHGLEWWESKLTTAKSIKKWNRVELVEMIEGYKKRLLKLELM